MQSCLGVLDVYEVDRAAGIYEHIGPEDFHSPYSAERHQRDMQPRLCCSG
jgi:hypothetical protein